MNGELADPAQEPVISITGLGVNRGGRTILRTGDWSLPADRHGLVSGPSGCGKTTLLHLIAGLELPDVGQIRVLGQTPESMAQFQRDRFRARMIGLVFQDFHLLPGLTVADNLRLPRWLAGLRPDPLAARTLLERMDVAHLADSYPYQLSQGEKQRIAIARAVINHPRLVIADEPTSALDADNAAQVLRLLLDEARTHGASLLVASHDTRIRQEFGEILTLEQPAT